MNPDAKSKVSFSAYLAGGLFLVVLAWECVKAAGRPDSPAVPLIVGAVISSVAGLVAIGLSVRTLLRDRRR